MSRAAQAAALAVTVLACFASPAQASAPRSELIDAPRMLQDLRLLSADRMQGRRIGTPGGARARAYVARRVRQSGLQAFSGGYVRPFTFRTKAGATVLGGNVVGFLPGTTPDAGWIVVSAHYDHLGVRQGRIYNGADDDASGVAALLALAARIKDRPLRHGVIFVAFDGEEAGEQGSMAFVRSPPVPLSSMVLNLNMDMVSRNVRRELYASGVGHYPYLRPYLERIASRGGVALKFGHDAAEPHAQDWTWQSDHYAFHKAGVPYVYFGVEDHPDYHRPTDDFARIDPDFYVRAVEMVAAALEAFDENLDAVREAERAGGRP
jgi:Zn-dependent M28 family amino/carboxypeptidase